MNKHDEGISKEEYWQTYVVWNSVFILIQSIIFISLLFRILKYRKDRYIDMFKLIQYVTAFICLAVSFSSKLLELIFVEKAMFFSKLYRLNDTNLINFQIISQFWWLTMIVHITSYERMKNIIFYGYAKKRIKIYEITIVILFLTHFLLTNAWYIAVSRYILYFTLSLLCKFFIIIFTLALTFLIIDICHSIIWWLIIQRFQK